MQKKSHDVKSSIQTPSIVPHPQFHSCNTFDHILRWAGPCTINLPRLEVTITSINYLQSSSEHAVQESDQLNFQQDSYRLWYQIDGSGILHNVTRKSFGTAKPGLLGVMDRGERHTYLHQRGNFCCFQILFSLSPSAQSKCFWNSEIEGKTILDESDRHYVEQIILSLLQPHPIPAPFEAIPQCASLLQLLTQIFEKQLICVEESRFPRNKQKFLVSKAKQFIDIHYQSLQHQDALEEECHIDINYLNILFKKETGNTLYHYLSSVRMEHAKHLLETTPTNITTIASSIGYPNANSFSRAFKRIEHTSPAEYRTRFKKTIK